MGILCFVSRPGVYDLDEIFHDFDSEKFFVNGVVNHLIDEIMVRDMDENPTDTDLPSRSGVFFHLHYIPKNGADDFKVL